MRPVISGEDHFKNVYYIPGEEPVFCYRSGLTVYEEIFSHGRLTVSGWNAAGYPMNVLGSNVCNILLILGGSALIHPLSLAGISYVDFGILFASAVALMTACFIGKKNMLDRVDGVLFLLLFVAYMTYLIVNL